MATTLCPPSEHGQLPGVDGWDTVRNGPRWSHNAACDHVPREGTSSSSANLLIGLRFGPIVLAPPFSNALGPRTTRFIAKHPTDFGKHSDFDIRGPARVDLTFQDYPQASQVAATRRREEPGRPGRV